jgi:ABC-type glycerol-3-phosphate transport system permease component
MSANATRANWAWGLLGWLVAAVLFFPIFWITITSFKTEQGAYSPNLIFMPTLESFRDVFARSNYLAFALNSIYISIGSTLVCFLLAIPAAYKMSFFPTAKTQPTLLWMLSTKMMPAVEVLVPIYLMFKTVGLLDSVPGLIFIYTLMNLPIAVWMSYTYFCEIPAAILEAARIDGASLLDELWHVLRPMAFAGPVIDGVAVDHLKLERGVLEHQPDQRQGGAPDGVHRELLEPRRAVLGQAVGGLGAGGGAHPGDGLADPEATGARPDLRRREKSML